MTRILLIEDDPVLGRGLSVHLESEGYTVDWVESISASEGHMADRLYELIILDLGLPDGNGLQFLKLVRTRPAPPPVLILTAQIDEEVVVEALQSGASDYVRKPFSSRELFARIKNILREPQDYGRQIRFGGISVMLDRRSIEFNDVRLDFNRREFDILVYLIQNAEKVVTRESLIQHLNNAEDIVDRTIDSYVYRIRNRLRSAGVLGMTISSNYGMGYRLHKSLESKPTEPHGK
jgi:DNA-binding response OmpR family regulator